MGADTGLNRNLVASAFRPPWCWFQHYPRSCATHTHDRAFDGVVFEKFMLLVHRRRPVCAPSSSALREVLIITPEYAIHGVRWSE